MSRWRQIQMRNWLMRKKKRPRILCLSECARELVEKMMQTCTSTMVSFFRMLKRLHVSLLQRAVPCIQQLRSCKKESLRIALW
ncbi:hypothetical protein IGI04_024534 [Brassica rapa subsp. trilocularis]|uniref:Uncharacterized protein n=1 Tax=Brassica rapa subsp. trilocularis TaxID=1813537 RepID=A0ABQ7M9E8_BRACM|nr:hypothetical protein IGI04_024534 [Brassica rapa subsp. trilocularis]